MEEKRFGYKENIDCAELYDPFPECLTCPYCGEDIEIWTDEEETKCLFCGFHLFRKEAVIH